MYEQDPFSALEAIAEAQRIAFAPMLFQTAVCLRKFRVLEFLDKQGKEGATLAEIVDGCDANEYAVGVLLDMALSGRIITQREGRFYLAKVGHFLLHDPMTRVNMDFSQDVCYQGLYYLEEALQQGKPAGLRVFGDWPTIYPALSQLPNPARDSWFAFDHYYSDAAFNAALPHIFASEPVNLYDVGGNTGKWAMACCKYDANISVTLLDLPEQIALARRNVDAAGLSARIHFHPVDMLGEAPLPGDADIWWMSQFLDCFSPEQIVTILSNIAVAMKPDAKLCVMELFCDAQKFDAAAFSLHATSLYFTCMANGNSRFYSAENFLRYLDMAGFSIEKRLDNLGVGHTLLICHKK